MLTSKDSKIRCSTSARDYPNLDNSRGISLWTNSFWLRFLKNWSEQWTEWKNHPRFSWGQTK